MDDKVIKFLYEIGFTDDEIDELLVHKPAGFYANGKPYYNIDLLYAITETEEKHVEVRETGEIIEAYWDKGWVSGGFYDFHRSNYDSYKKRYYKAFPTRYNLYEFKFTKSLRRVLNKNRDLKTVIRPLRVTPQKSDLHDTYNYLRHGEMPKKSLLERYKYVSNDDSKKMELCIFKGDKLVACSFFEVGMYALYSNSAFWDLDEKARSLGTLTILLEARYALSRGLHNYYLGHFYVQNPAYHYKARFGGFQLYDWDNDRWVYFRNPRVKELLKQKLPRHAD